MTDEQARLERKIDRLERALDDKTMTTSERQAASLGIRPKRDDSREASKRQAERLLGDA